MLQRGDGEGVGERESSRRDNLFIGVGFCWLQEPFVGGLAVLNLDTLCLLVRNKDHVGG